jgi:FAD/FMN-containing dehydrogenase/Fe-S oxidoreductase
MSELIDSFVADCQRELRGSVYADSMTRTLYATDASNYQIMPLAVVTPRDRDDMIAVAKLAARYDLPLLPRGGGSSLAGQSVGEAVILDTSKHMHNLVSVDPEARRARVQPGTTLQSLNGQLAKYGLKFGPDPASAVVCTIGGMIGNNSTGSHSILYHMTADHIHGLDVVLADGSATHFSPTPRSEISRLVEQGGLLGSIWQQVPAIVERYRSALDARRPNTWRRCGGYNLDRILNADPINLAELVCGSEGTFALISEAEIDLVPLPRHTAIILVAFDDQNASLEAVPYMLESDPAAIEQVDRFMMRMQREAGGDYSIGQFIGNDDPDSVLITEFYGDTPAEVQAKMAKLEEILKRHTAGCRIYRFEDAKSQATIWQMRRAQAGLLSRQRGEIKPLNFIEDVAVPVEHLAAYIRNISQVTQDLDVDLMVSAHASAGCLHVMPFVNLKTADHIEKMRLITQGAADLVLEYKGAMSSEHGDGLARSWLNRHIFGDEVYSAFQQVKAAFDPENRLNPNKVVNGPDMTENLRFGTSYRTVELKTKFDWSADGGFAGAIEMCNGQGYCRKVTAGTMCPSYMVTRNEMDSTRGRANALRNTLNGTLPLDTLYSDEMKDVLDLCVGCKACQNDCPSSVDMTRIKSEVMDMRHQREGIDLRTRLFGEMPRISQVMTSNPVLAKLANAATSFGPAAKLMSRVIGIAPERHLPAFSSQRFSDQHASSKNVQPFENPNAVVLYSDTWMEHHYPEVGAAAMRVLEAAGYEVIIPDYVCCGRTYLSKGMLSAAQLAAERVCEQLGPYAAAGIPIVGLEPSCILSFRDEYPALSKHPQRHALAQVALSFEEFVARNSLRFTPLFAGFDAEPILFHGHCHQKAIVGTAPAHQALALAGYEVKEIESACCGMAGSFGYEAEHFEVSKAMAERSLLPAVRASDLPVVAAGVSCRQQIGDLSGRKVIHPAQAMAQRLKL